MNRLELVDPERYDEVHTSQSTIYDSPFTIYQEFDLLTYILYGLFILSCVVLVVVVLLQPGKSGAGDLFSSSVSSTAFGPRGTASILAKITIGAAAAFMLIALMLSLAGHHRFAFSFAVNGA